MDQIESTSTPGLIAQLKGLATLERYRVATVSVEQYSKLSYVYLVREVSQQGLLRTPLARHQ